MSIATLTAPVHTVNIPKAEARAETRNRPTIVPLESDWLTWLAWRDELDLEIISTRTAANEPITDWSHLVAADFGAFVNDMADLDSLFAGR